MLPPPFPCRSGLRCSVFHAHSSDSNACCTSHLCLRNPLIKIRDIFFYAWNDFLNSSDLFRTLCGNSCHLFSSGRIHRVNLRFTCVRNGRNLLSALLCNYGFLRIPSFSNFSFLFCAFLSNRFDLAISSIVYRCSLFGSGIFYFFNFPISGKFHGADLFFPLSGNQRNRFSSAVFNSFFLLASGCSYNIYLLGSFLGNLLRTTGNSSPDIC